jgi:predicted exporter
LQEHRIDGNHISDSHSSSSHFSESEKKRNSQSAREEQRLADIQQSDQISAVDGELLDLSQIRVEARDFSFLIGKQFHDFVIENRIDEKTVSQIIHIHEILSDLHSPLSHPDGEDEIEQEGRESDRRKHETESFVKNRRNHRQVQKSGSD